MWDWLITEKIFWNILADWLILLIKFFGKDHAAIHEIKYLTKQFLLDLLFYISENAKYMISFATLSKLILMLNC